MIFVSVETASKSEGLLLEQPEKITIEKKQKIDFNAFILVIFEINDKDSIIILYILIKFVTETIFKHEKKNSPNCRYFSYCWVRNL